MGTGDADAELMLKVKEGDLAAFESLVERYKLPAVHLAARTLGDPDEAEDIAQAAFVQVFKAADRYSATAKFSTWLFTIVRNLCLNEIRRRSRHPADRLESQTTTDEGDEMPHQHQDHATAMPDSEALRGELEQKVAQALAELPEGQRTALVLHTEEELSYDEISAILGCSLSATKSLIFRGREKLKEVLKAYLKTGDWKNE